MIDPILSLTFSMHANKGAYALLLGSGVSRSAQIPTGWEIVQDLIAKMAKQSGEDPGSDPAKWYKEKFNSDPEYSDLLEALGKSREDRQGILRGYFEPSQENTEEARRLPQRAHKAIAELVGEGFVRVIVTTNFDRLIEQALQEAGVSHTVIHTADAAQGALPITHTKCTLVKPNGDYLDVRIRNSSKELSSYEKPMTDLLDRVFDEFGLVVCGWSAEWDSALRAALERCSTHRFTTFWTTRGALSRAATELCSLRRATLVQIADADSFFSDLKERVFALAQTGREHPLSAKIAVERLKKYLPDPRYKIEAHDLVTCEAERLKRNVVDRVFDPSVDQSGAEILRRVTWYGAASELVIALISTGCFWGDDQHDSLWCSALEQVADIPVRPDNPAAWNMLRLYPALLVMYAGAIAALSKRKYNTLARLLLDAKVLDPESRPAGATLNTSHVIGEIKVQRRIPGVERKLAAGSDSLFKYLREPLKDLIPNDRLYESSFDHFEVLLTVFWFEVGTSGDVPIGRYLASGFWHGGRIPLAVEELLNEYKNEKSDWWPLRLGLFGTDALTRFNEWGPKISFHLRFG